MFSQPYLSKSAFWKSQPRASKRQLLEGLVVEIQLQVDVKMWSVSIRHKIHKAMLGGTTVHNLFNMISYVSFDVVLYLWHCSQWYYVAMSLILKHLSTSSLTFFFLECAKAEKKCLGQTNKPHSRSWQPSVKRMCLSGRSLRSLAISKFMLLWRRFLLLTS